MSPTPADDHRLRAETVVPQHLPTQPTQVRQPFHRDGWVYEEKMDGWRTLTYKDGQTLRLESRKGVDQKERGRLIADP